MKLSIITINRNNSLGLKKTISSVVSQTFTEFEFIIIDGASVDESIDVIQSFDFSIIQSFKWISETDNGVYNAMNKGIFMAKGKYILFLNSGDYLVNNDVLQEVFSHDHSADILCGKCNISKKGKVIWTSNPPEFVTFGALYKEGLAHQSTFIKRSLFENVGVYREDFKYNSDINFWYQTIILYGARTEKVDTIISDYNLEGISSKEQQTEQYKREISEILSQSNFKKFIPDYEAWEKEKKSMEIFYWAKRKKILNFIILILYKYAGWLNNIYK